MSLVSGDSPAWHIRQFHARLEDVSFTFFWEYLDNIPAFQQVKKPLYHQVEETDKTCDIDLVSQP